MPTLAEIEQKLDTYMFLPDKDIIKLINGFCLTCRLPCSPLWLFIAAGSSAGKTMAIELYEKVPGFTQVDNMTSNTLQSGIKRTDKAGSFLDTLGKNSFIVFKDFTTMMSKDPEVLAEIMGQLRVVFDGSTIKLTGGMNEKQKWEGKVSMLGAGTAVLYSKNDQFAEMGQRMVIYNFEPQDDYAILGFLRKHQKIDKKKLKTEIQEMIKAYLESIKVPDKFEDLPDIDDETWEDLTHIAHLATTARSPVSRNKYTQEIIDKGMKESATRMFNQLLVTAYGLILQNPDGKLTQRDRKLLYKLGLDCIDPRRRAVLQVLTKFNLGGGIDEIKDEIAYTKDSALVFVEDLVVHKMVTSERVPYYSGKRTIYKIKDNYKDIIQRFENIEPENKPLPGLDIQEPLPKEPPAQEHQAGWDEIIK